MPIFELQSQCQLSHRLGHRATSRMIYEHLKVIPPRHRLGVFDSATQQFSGPKLFYSRELPVSKHPLESSDAAYTQVTSYQTEVRKPDTVVLHGRSPNASQKRSTATTDSSIRDVLKRAKTYEEEGRYAEAESLLKRSLETERKSGRPEVYSAVLNNLADTYREQGKYGDAEQLCLDAIRLEEDSGTDSGVVGLLSNELGLLYMEEGRYPEAESQSWRALSMTTKVYGKDSLIVAKVLNTLGLVHMDEGRYGDAEPLYRRSLEIRQKLLHPNHPDIGTAMNNLATAYMAQRNYSQAELLLKNALSVDKKAWGSQHPVVAADLGNLGELKAAQHYFPESERLLKEAFSIDQTARGPNHPKIAKRALELAVLYYLQGKYIQAAPLFKRGFENLARQFRYNFTYMSEQDRLAFLNTVRDYFPAYLAFCFNFRDRDPPLTGAMYDLVLWEKGLVAESMASFRAKIATSGDEEALRLLNELTAHRAGVARLRSAPTELTLQNQAKADQLEEKANQIERELVKRSNIAAKHYSTPSLTWRDVHKALLAGEAAVEFVRIGFDAYAQRGGQTQYVALVVTPAGTTFPALVPLGTADELEASALEDYRSLVENTAHASRSGLRFYQAIWKPLEIKLAGTKRVYVSLDGLLNQISLAAVPTDNGRLLIETWDVRVVLSTKDIVHKKQLISDRTAVLIGDPQFDLSEEQERAAVADLFASKAPLSQSPREIVQDTSRLYPGGGSTSMGRGLRSRDQADEQLQRLPGTGEEVRSLSGILAAAGWRVETYTGANALEETVKRVRGPRVLHVATHGFFESDQRRENRTQSHGSNLENAMLRSGLFFAGANRALQGTLSADLDDGILTAYEATSLSLQGTELVVLSACETGLGESANGEGIFGLRRALQEAGAESILMSMWKVPDSETRQLMTLFYRKWVEGKDKHAALQEAQLELRNDIMARWQEDRPQDWAAFVLVGP